MKVQILPDTKAIIEFDVPDGTERVTLTLDGKVRSQTRCYRGFLANCADEALRDA